MAMRFFRPPKAGEFGTLPFKSKKQSWSWMEINDKVKFVDKPITQSLLRFDNLLSKLAVETFQCIMRYMNDYPLKRGQTITDCVYEVLSLCHTNMPLRDEVYCQIIKQTTANRSRRSDSLLRGWRLFTILTAFFAASDGLQPYLLKYLADIAGDQRRPFSGVAQVSLANYKQTQKFGGRKFILAAAEVEAITNGKNIKRQGFELPGGQKRVLNIKTITVVEEVITELCKEMNIWSCAEQHEFSICYILLKDNSLHVLSNDEYILDITSELESRDEDYTLLLMRTVWIHPLREDNQLYIDVLFFQIVPNYMTGLLTTLPEADKVSAKTLDDAAMAAALLHAARGGNAATLSKETVMSLVPQTVFHISGLSQSNWLKRVTQKLAKLPSDCLYSAARLEFIRFIEKWPLFGSSFYFVSGVIHENLNVTDAIISINKNCIKVLKNHTMTTLESFDLCDVQSSRKYVLGDKSYLDINIGFNNSTSGTILHIETSASEEIARTIGQYIYLMSANRQDPITVFTNQNNNYSCA